MINLILVSLFVTNLVQPPCKLHGKVRFVTHSADYKVRIVNVHAKVKVKMVENFPDDPGEWKAVQSHEDFTVQVVQSGEDFTVQFVEFWPGC